MFSFLVYLHQNNASYTDTVQTKQTKITFSAGLLVNMFAFFAVKQLFFHPSLWQSMGAVWRLIIVFKLKLFPCFDQRVCSVELCFSCVNLSVGCFLLHCYLNAILKRSLLIKITCSAVVMDKNGFSILINYCVCFTQPGDRC